MRKIQRSEERKVKLVFSTIALILSGVFAGCASAPEPGLEAARRMILDGRAECVLVKDGRILAQESGGGVSPLLTIYETRKGDMADAVIVDKVVGRAAAAIAICGKARHVHGEVMSEDAAEFLKAHGITSGCTLPVPRILNRKRDGLCPLEQSVAGIDDPEQALAALKNKIESFRKNRN